MLGPHNAREMMWLFWYPSLFSWASDIECVRTKERKRAYAFQAVLLFKKRYHLLFTTTLLDEILTFQMNYPKLEEIGKCAQGHIASKCRSWISTLIYLILSYPILYAGSQIKSLNSSYKVTFHQIIKTSLSGRPKKATEIWTEYLNWKVKTGNLKIFNSYTMLIRM